MCKYTLRAIGGIGWASGRVSTGRHFVPLAEVTALQIV
jgi:hypothetical protein